MKDTMLKLLLLPFYVRYNEYIVDDFKRWRKDWWLRDLDDYMCCSGFDREGIPSCSCRGVSMREAMPWGFPDWMRAFIEGML